MTDTPAPRRTKLWALAAVALLGAVGLAAWLWWPARVPPPPAPPAVADPAIARALDAAYRRAADKPRSAEARGELGLTYLANDCRDEALACFRQAEALHPGADRWPYLQGLILLQGEPAAALEKLRAAVERAPGNFPARRQLAEALLAQGHLDEAGAQLEELRRRDPQDPYARLGLARLKCQQADPDGAERLLEPLLSSAAVRKAALTLKAELGHRRGDLSAAATLARARALPDDPLPPDPVRAEIGAHTVGVMAVLIAAQRAAAAGQIDAAIVTLERAADDYPTSERLFVSLGRYCMYRAKLRPDAGGRRADFEAAARALRRAVDNAPASAAAHLLLGSARLELADDRPDELDVAADQFRTAAELSRADAQAPFLLGVALRRRGRPVEALAAFRTALHNQPDHVDAHVQNGDLFAEAGCFTLALAHYAQALDGRPADAAIHLRLALLGRAPSAGAP